MRRGFLGLLGAVAFAFVGEKVLEGAEQKRAELAAIRIRLGHGVLLLQMETERLDQILGIMFAVIAPAHECVEWIPIGLEKTGEGFLGASGIVPVGAGEHDRPMGGIEIGGAVAAFVRRLHLSILGNAKFKDNAEENRFFPPARDLNPDPSR